MDESKQSSLVLIKCCKRKRIFKTRCKPLFTFLLLLLFTTKIFCQKQIGLDSLRKYSYSLLGYKLLNNQLIPVGGSCFFIRKANRIFLVTARHVVNGCEGAVKDKFFPKTIQLTIEDLPSNEGELPFTFLTINISEVIKNTPCNNSNLDIIAFEITDTITKKLFSVENFIHKPFKKVDDVEMFGFPGSSYLGPHGSFIRGNKPSNLHLTRNNVEYYSDSNHASMIKIVSNELKADSTYLKGYSGSPVFIKKYHSHKLRICGAFAEFGYDKINTDFRFIGVEKIDYAMRQIVSLINKDK